VTPEQFQRHVLGLLATTFPQEEFEGTPDPFLIKYGGAELGLHNLYALQTEKRFEPEQGDAHLREHFWHILEALSLTQEASTPPWEEARDKLRLQIMRTEHTRRAPVITFPFAGDVVVAIAIDLTHAYSYVSSANLHRWKVTEELAYEQALSNLERASDGIQIHASEKPQRLLAIQTGDGYDAARLLLPAMRKLAVEQLGEPCYAALPNRDFLILWARSNPEEFQSMVRAQIRQDSESQPYPLTSTVFVVTQAEVKPDVA
jgi:uncharacterized protein YtpQ (UPF0354 family)